MFLLLRPSSPGEGGTVWLVNVRTLHHHNCHLQPREICWFSLGGRYLEANYVSLNWNVFVSFPFYHGIYHSRIQHV